MIDGVRAVNTRVNATIHFEEIGDAYQDPAYEMSDAVMQTNNVI